MLEKFVQKFGACPIQYKFLLQTEKTLEERALEGKQGLSKLPLPLTCVFCFFISIFAALTVYYGIDVFNFALIGVAMSMSIVGFWLLPYFDLLLSPINYPVVAHTPISSSTYFLVKLTQLLRFVVYILLSFNLFPSLCGIFIRSETKSFLCYIFPLFYLPIAILSGFFTIGVMTIFAGYITKLHSIKGLRKISKSAQFLIPLLFLIFFLLFPFNMFKENLGFIQRVLTYLPFGWFAGSISLLANKINHPDFTRDLIHLSVSIISTILLVFIPLRSIAKTYSKYLSFLLESIGRQKVILKMRTPLLARYFRSRIVYAVFSLCAIYMRRDRQLLNRIVSGVVVIGLVSIMMFIRKVYPLEMITFYSAIGLSPGLTALFVYFGVTTVMSFLSTVGYSEHYKASWILSIVSIHNPYQVWRGTEITAMLHIVLPITVLFFIVATIFWGVTSILFILPGFLVIMFSVILYPKPSSNIPLSQEPVEVDGIAGCLAFAIGMIAAGVLVAVLFLARIIHLWVYIGAYSVIVIGGFISFIRLYKKNSIKEDTHA